MVENTRRPKRPNFHPPASKPINKMEILNTIHREVKMLESILDRCRDDKDPKAQLTIKRLKERIIMLNARIDELLCI